MAGIVGSQQHRLVVASLSDSLSMHCSLLIPACAYSTTVFTIPNASPAFLNKTLWTSANRNNGKRTHSLGYGKARRELVLESMIMSW